MVNQCVARKGANWQERILLSGLLLLQDELLVLGLRGLGEHAQEQGPSLYRERGLLHLL